MRLILATANRDKGKEIDSILNGALNLDLVTLSDFPDVQLPPETGLTYQENAILKATVVAKSFKEWALGDDSGLEIDALNGAPGLYSARFAGENVSYADNRKKVLDLMENVPDTKRQARFICTIAIANPNGEVEGIVEGVCEGKIARVESGGNGFGYDPLFYLLELGKTFAELTHAQKNKVSHRGVALQKAIDILKGHL